MAITIEEQPELFTPVGQRLIYIASSTNSGNDGFRYVFEFADFTINVQPNANGYGVLDVAPIFREKLLHNTLSNFYNITDETSSVIEDRPTIKEGWLINGVFTVTSVGQALPSRCYFFLAEYQVSDGYKPDTNTRYALNTTDKYLLSERLNTTHVWSDYTSVGGLTTNEVYIPARLNDYGVMYAIGEITTQLPDTEGVEIAVNIFNQSNTLIDTIYYPMSADPLALNVFGTYPANLLADGATMTNWKWYDVYARNAGGSRVSRRYVFYRVEDDCTFDNVRLMWTNTCGGVDYFNFTKKSELSYNYERKQYQKVIGNYNSNTFSFNTYDRGVTDRYVGTTKGLVINSDWLSVGEFQFLNTLMRSNDVYIVDDGGAQIPVLVEASNYVVKDERYSKLYNLTINLKYSQGVGL
jgi:hypothetical protein